MRSRRPLARLGRRLDRRVVAILAVPLVCWLAYVIRVRRRFHGYRFLIPVLPLTFLGTYWVICELDVRPARAAVLTSLVLAGGMLAYRSPRVPSRRLAAAYGRTLVTPNQEWYRSAQFSVRRLRSRSNPGSP